MRETNFLKFHGCIVAIRKYMNFCNFVPTYADSNEFINIFKIVKNAPKGAKRFYNVLLSDNFTHNSCLKWSEKIVTDISWGKVFVFLNSIKEIKLKWFQIRILHRIIGTNVTLKAMGIRDNDFCAFCKERRESIIHLFFECNISKGF